jgi:hypothetical protein
MRRCPSCGIAAPTRGRLPGTGFEWRTEAEFLGYPLIHVAVGRDQDGKPRVAKGLVAIGQYGIGGFTIAQFGFAFVLGIGQFMAGPIVIGQVALGLIFGAGQLATGYAAIGQLALGNYAIGQFGFSRFFWGPDRHDPQALEFFRRLLERVGWHFNR